MKKVFNLFCNPEPVEYFTFKYSVYCMFVLLFVVFLDQSSRWALPTLQGAGLQCSSCNNDTFREDCLKDCLDIDDVAMGFLLGPAIEICQLLLAIPLGWYADRYSRVRLLTWGCMLWSVSMIGAAFSYEFWHLAVVRIVIGLGESTISPTGYSLISDYFTESYRATVLAIFYSMLYVGLDIGLLSSFVALIYGWRVCFLILGGPGLILLTPLILTVKDPVRGISDDPKEIEGDEYGKVKIIKKDSYDDETESLVDDNGGVEPFGLLHLKSLITNKTYVCLWITMLFRYCAGSALGTWMQTFYRRVYGLPPGEISTALAIIIPIAGLGGSFSGGWFADKLRKKWNPAGRGVMLVISSVGGLAFILPMLLVKDAYVSLAMLFLSLFFSEMWPGPAVAIAQDEAPPQMRSLATTIFYTTGGFGSLASLLVGTLNEYFAIPTPYSPSYDPTYALLIIVPTGYAISAIGYFITTTLIYKSKKNEVFDQRFTDSDGDYTISSPLKIRTSKNNYN
eukprot:TRINITY_DN1051_c0_g4_i1.p1 TRINITY_DN1051_c0_g4~~TRINITY_DN1051_c0_g4_i1.p1  ORF type:complete len:508 (+),score=50.69 TRINITY_DN1051_c0_g4_i1:48-1571(+)